MDQVLLKKINDFINIKPSSRKEYFFACLSSRFFFFSAARGLSLFFRERSTIRNGEESRFNIAPYSAKNPHVLSLIQFLEKKLCKDLAGAYLHGSLGSDEEVAYSDFDALVIIKNEVFQDHWRLMRVAHRLNRATKFMYRLDPLQHHGWFVLSEKQLMDYPVTYFPPELFAFGKSLMKETNVTIRLTGDPLDVDFKSPLLGLCDGILRLVKRPDKIKNFYQFKSLLSEFMLVPALYVQAREKKGVFKKMSFGEAKKDFSIGEWEIMDTVSEIRRNWVKPEINSFFKKLVYHSPGFLARQMVKRNRSMIRAEISSFNNTLLMKMEAFVILVSLKASKFN